MRRLVWLAAVLAAALAVGWILRPSPIGACSCLRDPVLFSDLARVDGSTAAPSMCLLTDESFTALLPCDATVVFDDEIFRGPQ